MAYNAPYRTTADLTGQPYQPPNFETPTVGHATMMYRASQPAYQLDFNVEDLGKRLASSKRLITWRFGFPNTDAIDQGMSGEACRGEEHEVKITWSLQSGKRSIVHNEREVHFSQARSNKVDHSWNAAGYRGTTEPRVIKVIAYDFPETNRNGPQYELFVNGLPFSRFAKLYEVGQVVSGAGVGGMSGGGSGLAPIGIYQPGMPQYASHQHPQSGYYQGGPRPTRDTNEDLDYAVQASLGDAYSRQYR